MNTRILRSGSKAQATGDSGNRKPWFVGSLCSWSWPLSKSGALIRASDEGYLLLGILDVAWGRMCCGHVAMVYATTVDVDCGPCVVHIEQRCYCSCGAKMYVAVSINCGSFCWCP